MPSMPKQTRGAKEVSRERCMQVAKAIAEGKIQLPQIEKDQVLILGDSGSAPNVANHARQFPGSKITPHAKRPEFQTATGQVFNSKGEMVIPATSLEGYERVFTFDDADVTVPILSIGKLTDDGNDVLFQKRGGKIIHIASGEIIHFKRMHGVYFITFNINSALLKPPPVPIADFRRPGIP